MRSLFFVLLLASSSAWAENEIYSLETELGEDVNCYHETSAGTDWNYCITKTVGSANQDVLFEFHGIAENENSWITKDRNARIRQAWHDNKLQAPTVVSISFGNMWLLAEKNGAERSGLFEIFRDQVYPTLLQKLGTVKGQKLLLGASMGGFNASQIYVKLPQLFDRYTMICPIINDVSPFAGDAEIAQYVRDTGASSLRVYAMIQIAKMFYSDPPAYEKAQVFRLGEQVLNSKFPDLFLAVSHEDPYGIYRGVERFKNLVASKGISVRFVDTHGGHCDVDSTAIAKNLVGQ